MKNIFLILLVIVSIVLLVFTNMNLFYSNQQNYSNLEIVKSQLTNAKSGLVNYPVPNYPLTITISIVSFVIGVSFALIFLTFFPKNRFFRI